MNILSLPRTVKILFLGSFALYLAIEFGNTIPACCWPIHRLGVFGRLAATAMITSTIFYYFAIHIPKAQRRNRARKFTDRACRDIIGNWYSIVSRLQRTVEGFNTDIALSSTSPSNQQLADWLKALDQQDSPLNRPNAKYPEAWHQFLERCMNRSVSRSDQLLGMFEIDDELIEILSEVKTCQLWDFDIAWLRHNGDDQLGLLGDDFSEYNEIIKRLMAHLKILRWPDRQKNN